MTILTPLTEAGTPEEKENISVCSCGNPYVGTFIFPYAEWYCIECGSKHGLLGVSRVSVPKTDNLYRKWQKNVEKFEQEAELRNDALAEKMKSRVFFNGKTIFRQ